MNNVEQDLMDATWEKKIASMLPLKQLNYPMTIE